MTTLAEFLLARIADDEAEARAATPGPWETRLYWFTSSGQSWASVPDVIHEEIAAEDGIHIARWDPARVLAECDAKRRIVDEHRPSKLPWPSSMEAGCRTCGTAQGWDDRARQANCITLRALALPYADHEEYRPEWKPT
jgi:hypothetical protein